MEKKIPITEPGQIIAIGDSLTAGSQPGITEFAPYADALTWTLLKTSYPYMLGEVLCGDASLVLNLGRGGATSLDWTAGRSWQKKGVKDFPLNGYPLDAIMASPKDIRICLMMIGTNDVNYSVVPDWIAGLMGGITGYEDNEFLTSRENIISTLINLSEKKMVIYLAKIPPNSYPGGLQFLGLDRILFSCRRAQERLKEYTRMINERIEEIWESYPSLVRRGPDFYALLHDEKNIWLDDRLHLNAHGYSTMAKAWAAILERDVEMRISSGRSTSASSQ
ncbi:MAG TPA: SGNH/GDSL hydrolase family protein [Deltaproteobacteria bacterium]|nr:SGNH/GDSL hydrolase family protein [Deltaproteobacteria bacterium]